MTIRPEVAADAAAIDAVVTRAFRGHPHSAGTEAAIVGALRAAGALTVSLVAVKGLQVIGHVAFSPVTVGSGASGWYGLGPLSVEPAWQRQGVGSALTRAGLSQIRALGAAGCTVLGDPGYYSRFGFASHADLVYPGPAPDHFMALAFGGPLPRGEVEYHPAFAAT